MKLIDLGNNFASLPCKPIHNKFWHCKLIVKKKKKWNKMKERMKEWKKICSLWIKVLYESLYLYLLYLL